jgi:hypothetical protein
MEKVVVYKYELKPGEQKLVLPVGSKLLCVATQNELPHVWALVPFEQGIAAEPVTRIIKVVATGELFEHGAWEYVGSVFAVHGWMVFHVFVRYPRTKDADGGLDSAVQKV